MSEEARRSSIIISLQSTLSEARCVKVGHSELEVKFEISKAAGLKCGCSLYVPLYEPLTSVKLSKSKKLDVSSSCHALLDRFLEERISDQLFAIHHDSEDDGQ
ncbi:Threonine synthase, partial [Dissostichus eleginoides]